METLCFDCGAAPELLCRLDEFLAWKGQYEYFTRLRFALLWVYRGQRIAGNKRTLAVGNTQCGPKVLGLIFLKIEDT
jgi:hypothetical protein